MDIKSNALFKGQSREWEPTILILRHNITDKL